MKAEVQRLFRLTVRVIQWSVFAFLALLCVTMIFLPQEMRAADVSPVPFYVALSVFALVSVALVPPLFFRLPKRVKIGAYLALLPAFIGIIATHGAMDAAYAKTPQGIAAAERAAATEAVELERLRANEERQEAEALFEQHRENVADMHRSVERCINWRGQIPSLVGVVKDALHNPRSFEHVETQVRSVGDTPAVTMEYRAENGFGAVRTASVSAFISPDDCSVVAVDGSR